MIGRRKKTSICVEAEVGRVRQRHENWEPATDGRVELEVTELNFRS